MKALLQRVTHAKVTVEDQTVGEIQHGLLVFLGVELNDTEAQAKKLAQRVLGYRMFADSDDKTNLSVSDIQGEILVVSQFTLAADTNSGRRPSFSTAAPPAQAQALYDFFVDQLRSSSLTIATGQFGGAMQVSLTNDGPMTFLLTV
ncbi:D-tyrosyl-tRNA(Tyr) deacylase [Pseudidiomarina aestuarii]|uniref:D-aminoacyl-tRNA deacylase n=1 Tax=Pseudidiomarina aestuarii TaxID=624146 RepID=A0A7Z6ZRT8_9GAMM|nr:D-aminoacyl-tRNA deacylase [Pseudidiomarina aestuarii]RUO39010.1 D-tyrosyl-tRNA(Tyr) deacylase [Pseudidiomarina aestuarii]